MNEFWQDRGAPKSLMAGAMMLAAVGMAAPVSAQGLLGRLGKAIDAAERETNEAERKVDQTDQAAEKGKRLLGRLTGGPKRPAPDAAPAPQADLGADAGGYADDAMSATDRNAEAPPLPPPLLLLSDKFNLSGRFVELTEDTPSLHLPTIKMGDVAQSLMATGRWELCADTNYRGTCVVYEGRHDRLTPYGGKFSSARYLGPSGDE